MNRPPQFLFAPEGGEGGGSGGGAPGGEGRSLIPPAGGGAPAGGAPAGGAPAGGAPAGGAVGEIWWKGWVKEDGSLDKTRLSHLPEDLKGSQAMFARYNNLADFAKSFAHAQHTISQRPLAPLREGATEAEKTEHLATLRKFFGAPDKPEGYGLKKPDGMPDERWDQSLADEMAKVFHAHALPPSAVKDVLERFNALQDERIQKFEEDAARAEDEAWKAQETALKREFGSFQQEKFAAARRGAKWMGIDPDSPLFKTNAALIIAAAKVGEKIGEAQFIDGGSPDGGSADPEKELAEMASNPTHKFYDVLRNPSKNPRLYEDANRERERLGRLIAEKRARQGAR